MEATKVLNDPTYSMKQTAVSG